MPGHIRYLLLTHGCVWGNGNLFRLPPSCLARGNDKSRGKEKKREEKKREEKRNHVKHEVQTWPIYKNDTYCYFCAYFFFSGLFVFSSHLLWYLSIYYTTINIVRTSATVCIYYTTTYSSYECYGWLWLNCVGMLSLVWVMKEWGAMVPLVAIPPCKFSRATPIAQFPSCTLAHGTDPAPTLITP